MADCDHFWPDFGGGVGDWSFDRDYQAATSINEMTLSFVPKVVLVLLTFGLAANYILVGLTDYFAFIFDQITQVG